MVLFKNLSNFLRRDADGVPGGPPAGGEPPAVGGTPPPPAPSDTVQLSKEEYATLLAEHALMKQQLSTPPAPPKPAAPATAPKPLDQMNGAELASYLEANSLQPIVNTVMQLAVQQELATVKQKYGEDFNKGQDAIYNICKENPHLSLEQGYLLWKGAEASKAPSKPATPPTPPPPGEKPGIPPASTEKNTVMSAREAALKAMKDLNLQP